MIDCINAYIDIFALHKTKKKVEKDVLKDNSLIEDVKLY